LMSEYFIVRSLAVHELTKIGKAGAIPLWLGVTSAVRLIKAGVQDNPIVVGFWGITVFVAARMGLRGGNRHHRLVRRPDEPWTPVVAPSTPGQVGWSVPPPPPPPAPLSQPGPPPPFT
jgi:hypothetical protein